MSSIQTFVISDDDDEDDFDEAVNVASILDRRDFLPDGYPVDERRYPRLGRALLKGKNKARDGEDDLDDEEASVLGDTPSSATINLEEEDAMDEAIPLPRGSESMSEVGGESISATRRLPFLDMDSLNISSRPGSAPAAVGSSGRQSSSAKRRKVSSTGVPSPLSRDSSEDDRLRRLEQKIEEQERQRQEMEERLRAREEELRTLQERRDADARQRDEESKATQLKMHQELMQMFSAISSGALLGQQSASGQAFLQPSPVVQEERRVAPSASVHHSVVAPESSGGALELHLPLSPSRPPSAQDSPSCNPSSPPSLPTSPPQTEHTVAEPSSGFPPT